MDMVVLSQLCDRIVESGWAQGDLEVLWHSGEPLTLPPSYYKQAIEVIEKKLGQTLRISYSLQTNGILIDDEWCDFFQGYKIKIGVSIDGPSEINDLKRRTQNNKGASALTLKGINILKANKIPFHVLAVLTKAGIRRPQDIYYFFKQISPISVGFNIDEIDGANNSSTFCHEDKEDVTAFYRTLIDLQNQDSNPLVIREIVDAKKRFIYYSKDNATRNYKTHPNNPFSILSCDTMGNISTFSPELFNIRSEKYNNFCLGNIKEMPLQKAIKSQPFKAIARDIESGIDVCKKTCKYFGMCKGGTPSNKMAEAGTFITGETVNCRMNYQAPIDAIIQSLKSYIN